MRGLQNTAWIRWLPAIACMGIIFYLSSRTGSDLNGWLPFFRRIIPAMSGFDWGHFVAYFVLSLTFYWALGHKFHHIPGMALIVLLCFLYGVTDEYHQSFVPGRTPDVADLRNDAIGAALAMLIVYLRRRMTAK